MSTYIIKPKFEQKGSVDRECICYIFILKGVGGCGGYPDQYFMNYHLADFVLLYK